MNRTLLGKPNPTDSHHATKSTILGKRVQPNQRTLLTCQHNPEKRRRRNQNRTFIDDQHSNTKNRNTAAAKSTLQNVPDLSQLGTQHQQHPEHTVDHNLTEEASAILQNTLQVINDGSSKTAAVDNENIVQTEHNLHDQLQFSTDIETDQSHAQDLFNFMAESNADTNHHAGEPMDDSDQSSVEEEDSEEDLLHYPSHQKQFKQSLRLIVSWNRLFSLLCITGSIRFSARQYGILAAAILTVSKGAQTLRTYKTVRSSQWNFLQQHLFPNSKLIYIFRNHRRMHRSESKRTITTQNRGKQDPRDCVRIVMPSEWAKIDVLTLPIYNNLYNKVSNSGISVEDSPLIKDNDKGKYVSGRCSLWATYKTTIIPTSLNDLIQVQCGPLTGSYLDDNSTDEWLSSIAASTTTNINTTINGRAGPLWCVKSKRSSRSTNLNPIHHLLDNFEIHMYNIANVATHSFDDLDSLSAENNRTNSSRTPSTSTNQARGRGRSKKRGGRLTTGEQSTVCQSTETNNTSSNSTNSQIQYDKLFLFPGDTCTIIRPPHGVRSEYICLLIASFVWREKGRVGERLIWLKKSAAAASNDDPASTCIPLWCQVLNMPTIPDDYVPSALKTQSYTVRNQGILQDGTPYYVYRFLLYADGFKQNKTMKNSKSVYGCYIMPAGLSHDCRNSCTAARVLTLAAHGQDVNEVMEHIVDDIVEGSSNGFDSYDINGKKVKVFLDPGAIIGDYLAAAANTDVSGHTADAFCSFCVIRRRKGGKHPEILFSNKLHSRRPSLVRFDERMNIVRTESITPPIKKHLGISCSSNVEAWYLIAVKLAKQLAAKQSEVRKNNHGVPVVDPTFDSHLSAAACPDHLFNGLIENVLTVCFKCLSTDDERRKIDTMVSKYIHQNRLPSIDSVLSWDLHGKFKGLNNLTTSALFCVLLYCAPLFKRLHSTNSTAAADPFDLPQKLQDIVSLVYYWPHRQADTVIEHEYVSGVPDNGNRPLDYYGDVQRLCENYLESIKKYYIKGGRLASILDKPNAHRLLELAMHTIPTFKHALNVSELVLEMVHRVFKEWLMNNPNHDAHITGVDIALARDWSARLHALFKIWKFASDPREKEAAYIGLKRLLLGAAALDFPDDHPYFKNIFTKFQDALTDAFQEPVLTQMKGNSRVTFLQCIDERWVGEARMREDKIGEDMVKCMAMVRKHLEILDPDLEDELSYFAAAILLKVEEYSEPRRANTYTTIHVGDVVSSVIQGSTLSEYLAAATHGLGRKELYKVYGIVGYQDELWIAVRLLKQVDVDDRFVIDDSGALQILRLTTAVRRASAVHACTDACKIQTSGLRIDVLHDDREKTFHVLTAKDGFPPQMG